MSKLEKEMKKMKKQSGKLTTPLLKECCISCKHKLLTRSTNTRMCALNKVKVSKYYSCDDWQPTTALAKLAKQFNTPEKDIIIF